MGKEQLNQTIKEIEVLKEFIGKKERKQLKRLLPEIKRTLKISR